MSQIKENSQSDARELYVDSITCLQYVQNYTCSYGIVKDEQIHTYMYVSLLAGNRPFSMY